MTGLHFDPALPWPLIAGVAALALLGAVWALWRGLPGWVLRGLAGIAAAVALAGPVIERGVRQSLSDIVILIDDRSASQGLPGRGAQADAAVAQLSAQLSALPGGELRRVTVGDDADGTLLGTAMTRALAAEPEGRVAGVIAVTDGQAADAAMVPASAPAPVHVLLTGQPADWDRRLVVEEAPAFGLIGQTATIRVSVQDQGAVPPEMAASAATLRVRVDGEDEQMVALPPGVPLDLPVEVAHAGQNVVSLRLDPPQGGPAQLTDRNDAAAIQIEGVRDRLRVLLVSGEPHPGERTWRNLLKSDANVDLVHFTILRPPDKSDGVPVDEMALIAFPTRELFEDRIGDFDLIIFDRYKVRGILPPQYYENIRRYVEEGGALLVSAGPEIASVESLNLSPLGEILPGRPTGRVIEEVFTPLLTDAGRRHPVTAGLPGAPASDAAPDTRPSWGRWLQRGQIIPKPGAEVVMSAGDNAPLMVLDRVGEGRVALLASDQVWLWGRGFEGGGPQLELLRRMAHWSMKEPELEEEALLAQVGRDLSLMVTRRTMKDAAGPVRITGPDGTVVDLALEPDGPGRFAARWQAPAPGLYTLVDGDLSRLVALGPAAPREFEQTVAMGSLLAPLADATGGAVIPLSDGIPDVRIARSARSAHGEGVVGDWIGITPREAAQVSGLSRRPILPDWAWLVLIAGLAVAGWLLEGGRLRRSR